MTLTHAGEESSRASLIRAVVVAKFLHQPPLFNAFHKYRHSTAGPGEGDTPEAPAASGWDGHDSRGHEQRSNYPLARSVDDHGEGFMLHPQVL